MGTYIRCQVWKLWSEIGSGSLRTVPKWNGHDESLTFMHVVALKKAVVFVGNSVSCMIAFRELDFYFFHWAWSSLVTIVIQKCSGLSEKELDLDWGLDTAAASSDSQTFLQEGRQVSVNQVFLVCKVWTALKLQRHLREHRPQHIVSHRQSFVILWIERFEAAFEEKGKSLNVLVNTKWNDTSILRGNDYYSAQA